MLEGIVSSNPQYPCGLTIISIKRMVREDGIEPPTDRV